MIDYQSQILLYGQVNDNCGGQSPPQAENLTILHLQKCIFYSKNSVSEGVFEAKQGEMPYFFSVPDGVF